MKLLDLILKARQNATGDAASLLDEAAKLLRRSDGDAGRRELLRQEIAAQLVQPTADGYAWVWVRDVFPETVVYEIDGELYQVSYTITGDEKTAPAVTFGTPEAVEVAYTPKRKPAKEAEEIVITGDVVPLVETALREAGKAQVKIIDPGWGSSGYYSKEVLRRDGPRVFTKGTHMYWNHPTASEEAERPERDLNDLAGVLTSDARWEDNGPSGPGLYATAEVRSDYQKTLAELAPHIGVSIRAYGKAVHGEADGKTGPIIQELVKAESVDYVTIPGRGGEVLRVFESARRRPQQTGGVTVDEKEIAALKERLAKLEEDGRASAAENARLRARLALREAKDQAVEALAANRKLNEATRRRLLERLVPAAPISEGQLDAKAFGAMIEEAVKEELAYLADVLGEGRIRGLGGVPRIPLAETARADDGEGEGDEAELDKAIEASFVGLLGEQRGKLAALGRS